MHMQERVFLLVVLPITRWVTLYILLQDLIFFQYEITLFLLQFFNSMSLLWATIFHSPINHFRHINIWNWSSHGGKQQSTLTQQKSLVNPIYFNAQKFHITMPNFQHIQTHNRSFRHLMDGLHAHLIGGNCIVKVLIFGAK